MKKTLPLLALSLSGCAIGPVPTELAEPVTPTFWNQPQSGTGLLILKRDNDMNRSSCKFHVLIDKKHVGKLRIREKFELHLPPGEHNISGGCGAFVDGIWRPEAEAFVTVAAGETITYRISAQSNGDPLFDFPGFIIQRTAY